MVLMVRVLDGWPGLTISSDFPSFPMQNSCLDLVVELCDKGGKELMKYLTKFIYQYLLQYYIYVELLFGLLELS